MIEERRKQRAGFAEQPMMKPSIDLRKQFEALLTSEQLASYRDQAVRRFAAGAVNDRLSLRMIGASEQQQAEVAQFQSDSAARYEQFAREIGRKLLEILTPAQQEALWATAEVRPTRIEYASDSNTVMVAGKPAAEGVFLSPIKTGSGTLTVASTKFESGYVANFAGGTVTSTQNLSVPQHLPPYNGIFFPSTPWRGNLDLSAEQCNRLSKVSADFWTKFKELSERER